MSEVPGGVKPRRGYRSDRRREQAEETRRRVLAAAATLFERHGFEGASIGAIARAAGVSEETIYARFRSKRGLIGELVQAAVRGDDPRPVLEQDGPRRVAAATDQREQLRRFAADIGARLERAGPIFAVVAEAARSHPELAELVVRLHAHRLANLGHLVDALAANGELRLERGAAIETVWALTSPELHQLLRRRRGWSRRRHREWLAETLAALLLPPRSSR